MSTPALLSLLQAFHGEKLRLRQRHVAVARQVDDYNANNAYQNVIAREDVHLNWLEAAIRELGGEPATVDEPLLPAKGKKDGFAHLAAEDARSAESLVNAWRPRLAEVGNARHRTMMNVILGETLEHRRFFEQVHAGREDVLGRRSNGPGRNGTGNGVLGVRWIE